MSNSNLATQYGYFQVCVPSPEKELEQEYLTRNTLNINITIFIFFFTLGQPSYFIGIL